MAWCVGDGFDFYTNAGDAAANTAVWQQVSQSVIIAGGRFGIGKYVMLGNTSAVVGNWYTTQFANSTTIYVNMNITSTQPHVNGGTQQCVGFNWRDGSSGTIGTSQGGFYLRNGGDFVVVGGGGINTAVLGAPSSVLCPTTGVWHHIQVKIVVHNTAGSVELRMDGNTTPDYVVTGINTRNGTANFFANIIHISSSSVQNDFCDDFYAFNDQGAQPNTWQGDVFCIQQVPATDVGVVGWSRNSGTNNCLAVDDGGQDADATFVSTNVINAVDTYTITPLITTPAAIVAVTLRYFSRMDDAGPHAMNASLKSGPTEDILPNYVLTNNYVYQQKVYPADPNTGAPWAAIAVNDLLLNIKDVL